MHKKNLFIDRKRPAGPRTATASLLVKRSQKEPQEKSPPKKRARRSSKATPLPLTPSEARQVITVEHEVVDKKQPVRDVFESPEP